MVPVIGSIVAMVLGPYEFWEIMRRQAEQSAVGAQNSVITGIG